MSSRAAGPPPLSPSQRLGDSCLLALQDTAVTLTLPASIRAGNAGRGTGASSSFFYIFLFLTVKSKMLVGGK